MATPIDDPRGNILDGSEILSRAQIALSEAAIHADRAEGAIVGMADAASQFSADYASACSIKILQAIGERLAKAKDRLDSVDTAIEVGTYGLMGAATQIAYSLGCPPITEAELSQFQPRIPGGKQVLDHPPFPTLEQVQVPSFPVYTSPEPIVLADGSGVATGKRPKPGPEPVPVPEPVPMPIGPTPPDPDCPTPLRLVPASARGVGAGEFGACGARGGVVAHDTYVQDHPGGSYIADGFDGQLLGAGNRPHFTGTWFYLAPGQTHPCQVIPPQCWIPPTPPPPPVPDPTPVPTPIPPPPPPPPPPPDPTPCDPPPPCPEPDCPPGYERVEVYEDDDGKILRVKEGEEPPPKAQTWMICAIPEEPQVCPEKPTCAQEVPDVKAGPKIPSLNWCSTDICDQVGNVLAWLSNPSVSSGMGKDIPDLVKDLKTVDEVATKLSDDYFAWPWLLPIAKGVIAAGLSAYKFSVTTHSTLLGCDTEEIAIPWALKQLLHIFQRWVGLDLTDPIKRIDYAINHQCPVEIPSQSQSDDCRLMGIIDRDLWACWVRANNKCEDGAEKVFRAKVAKPNVDGVLQLWRREHIDDAECDLRLRELGVYWAAHREEFRLLSTVVPPYSDLVRMMVRDSFDEEVVARFEYDSQFAEKFRDKAKYWAKVQGVDETMMRYLWRAHWHLPSATQAFEMLNRLRPGRANVDTLTTEDDVQLLLEANDMAPFWQERLMAISKRPLRRIDLRKGYFIGAIDEQETAEQLLDLGYNERDAALQMGSLRLERVEWLVGRPVVRSYIRGDASEQDLDFELDSLRVGEPSRSRVKNLAQARRNVELRKVCFRGTRSRFMTYEIDHLEAQTKLVDVGYEPGEATQWVARWDCGRKSRSRNLSASALCDMAWKGIITLGDMFASLTRQGFSQEDAHRIIAACASKNQEKKRRAEEAERDAKDKEEKDRGKKDDKAKADEAKKRRAAEKEAKDRARAQREAQQAAEKEENAIERRRLMLEKALGYCASCNPDVAPILEDYFLDVIDELTDHRGYSLDGAYAWILELAKQSCSCGSPDPRAFMQERLNLIQMIGEDESQDVQSPPNPIPHSK